MASNYNQRSNSSASRRSHTSTRSSRRSSRNKANPFTSFRRPKSAPRPRVEPRLASTPTSSDRRRKRRVEASRTSRVPQGLPSLLGLLLGVIAIVILVVYLLSFTNMFPVKNIRTKDTTHIKADEIVKLADIDASTTVLNFDKDKITKNIKRNPWVKSVSITRSFPSDLIVDITERKVGYIVLIGPESVAWYVSDDNYWIEPCVLDDEKDTPKEEVALAKAEKLGCYVIQDLPASIEPKSGYKVTGNVLTSISIYTSEFSSEFKDRIASFSAPGEDSISCTLKSGVKVSLGNSVNVAEKEKIVTTILDEHENQVTYINVRLVDHPTYRKVNTSNVEAGSGAYPENDKQEPQGE